MILIEVKTLSFLAQIAVGTWVGFVTPHADDITRVGHHFYSAVNIAKNTSGRMPVLVLLLTHCGLLF
jgi:hypothetical protein